MGKENKLLTPDLKGQASITLGYVILQTVNNFPEPKYRPHILSKSTFYTIADINPHPYGIWVTADGIGTKPELAERLYEESKALFQADPTPFSTLAFDTFSMIDGDEARFGRFLVGIVEILDTNNTKDHDVVSQLAEGMKRACNEGHFALLNGETAELGYRTSGYGDARVNWNAVGVSVVVPEKLILGKELKPGQPIVVLREHSIRSNGLSRSRDILEMDFLRKLGLNSKKEFVKEWFVRQGFAGDFDVLLTNMRELFGHDPLEQVLLPWHKTQPEVTRQLLKPSRLYGPIIYYAQGGIEGERKVKMVAAAHISGGGVPEKGKRMVEEKGLGIHVDTVFPDPEGVSSLLKIVETFPKETKAALRMTNAHRTACEQWNRGVGFMIVTENTKEAEKLVKIAENNKCEAAIAGEVIDEPKIIWRGETWNYEHNPNIN